MKTIIPRNVGDNIGDVFRIRYFIFGVFINLYIGSSKALTL